MMDALSATASVITVIDVTVKVLKYLNDVKDAPKQRADCETELSSLYALLISLKYRINVSNPTEEWHKAVRTLGVEKGPLAQFRAILEELQRKVMHDGKLTATLKWKFTKGDVKDLRARIGTLNTTIQLILQLDQFEISKATKEDTKNIIDNIKDIKEDGGKIKDEATNIKNRTTAIFSSIQQHRYTETLRKALNWISPTNYPARQSNFLSYRHPGTGAWFLNSLIFKQWRQEPRSTLLCVGMPGAGKTIIAATVIEELGKTLDLEKDGVAYVFCNYKDQMDAVNMNPLAAILKQLLQNKPSAANPLLNLHRKHGMHGTYPTYEEILDALSIVMAEYASIYVVVDALDEFSTRPRTQNQLLENLRQLQKQADVHLLLTTRPLPEIVEQIAYAPRVQIRADTMDVKAFAEGQMDNLPTKVKEDSKFMEWVTNAIVQASDGMFLLVKLYIDRLADAYSKREVKSILQTLPKPSGEDSGTHKLYFALYDETMIRIEARPSSNLAKKTLSWITLARRPLTIEELRYALAVEPGDEDLDEDGLIDIDVIVSACAGLIAVEERTEAVRFIHYTAQEYFDRRFETRHPGAKAYVGFTTLAYLRFSSTKQSIIGNPLTTGRSVGHFSRSTMEKFPFLLYAIEYWPDHVAVCQKEISEAALSFIKDEFILNEAIISVRFTHNIFLANPRLIHFWTGASYLHVLAGFNLGHLFQIILDSLPQGSETIINAKDKYGNTPLAEASKQGHIEIVEMILKRNDVDVNTPMRRRGFGKSPLYSAAEAGHINIVRALLTHKDIDVNAIGWCGNSCLHRAAANGHLDIVQLLVERHHVEVNRPNENEETPLFSAIVFGREKVAHYLLGRDDVHKDCRTNLGSTLLHAAASGGAESVLLQLLKGKDYNIDERNKQGETALHLAISRARNLTITERLLEHGADATLSDNDGWTALHYAARENQCGIAKLLARTKGIDVEAHCTQSRTPLAVAVGYGAVEVAEYLMDELHADTRTRDNTDRSLILMAREPRPAWIRPNLRMVKILEERGFSVNN